MQINNSAKQCFKAMYIWNKYAQIQRKEEQSEKMERLYFFLVLYLIKIISDWNNISLVPFHLCANQKSCPSSIFALLCNANIRNKGHVYVTEPQKCF